MNNSTFLQLFNGHRVDGADNTTWKQYSIIFQDIECDIFPSTHIS